MPRTPVEARRSFRPRFCPRKSCPQHLGGTRFHVHGEYATKRCRRVPRFRCVLCRKTCSRQTFSTTYYLKKRELLVPTASMLQAGSGHRQIARTLGCAPSTVTRLAARLGRHAMLLQARMCAELSGRLDEPVVLDHFEAFEFTQDLPFSVATPVGSRSWFLYGLEAAPHGRGGRLSPMQKERLATRPRRRTRGGFEGSTDRTVAHLRTLENPAKSLRIVSDAHPAYARAARAHRGAGRVRWRLYPVPARGPKGSPRTREALERDRAMLPADALHQLLRHSHCAHHRETIAFGKRLNAVMERSFLFAVWRNLVKRISERSRRPETPAMRRGLTREPWTWRRVLSERQFPSRVELPQSWALLYRRGWTSPILPQNRVHALRHAF